MVVRVAEKILLARVMSLNANFVLVAIKITPLSKSNHQVSGCLPIIIAKINGTYER